MTEIWRDIPEFEGRYQVSNKGRVRSVERTIEFPEYIRKDGSKRAKSIRRFCSIIQRAAPSKSGHLSVVLGRKGGTKSVHVLVMLAFVGKRLDKQEVLHLDHNPANNVLENLKYGTRAENIKMSRDIGKYKPSKNFNRWGYRYE